MPIRENPTKIEFFYSDSKEVFNFRVLYDESDSSEMISVFPNSEEEGVKLPISFFSEVLDFLVNKGVVNIDDLNLSFRSKKALPIEDLPAESSQINSKRRGKGNPSKQVQMQKRRDIGGIGDIGDIDEDSNEPADNPDGANIALSSVISAFDDLSADNDAIVTDDNIDTNGIGEMPEVEEINSFDFGELDEENETQGNYFNPEFADASFLSELLPGDITIPESSPENSSLKKIPVPRRHVIRGDEGQSNAMRAQLSNRSGVVKRSQ